MAMTEAQQRELYEKFKAFGVDDPAALECTGTALIFRAFQNILEVDEKTAAILTQALVASLPPAS